MMHMTGRAESGAKRLVVRLADGIDLGRRRMLAELMDPA